MVSPEVAEYWLTRNTKNRPFRPDLAERYARDIRGGRWQFDGQPIRFSWDGRLLDGQHRLSAVVQTGIAIEMLVVYGLAPESQETMDRGKRRSVQDTLAMRGYRNASTLSSVARHVAQWRATGPSWSLTMHTPTVPVPR